MKLLIDIEGFKYIILENSAGERLKVAIDEAETFYDPSGDGFLIFDLKDRELTDDDIPYEDTGIQTLISLEE